MLIALTYAGWNPPRVLLAAAAHPAELLHVDLAPRAGRVTTIGDGSNAYEAETGLAIPASPLVAAIELVPRAGVGDSVVDLGALGPQLQPSDRGSWIVMDLDASATIGAMAGQLGRMAAVLSVQVSGAVATTWFDTSLTEAGLLSAIHPEYWVEGDDQAGAEVFRRLAAPIMTDIFTDRTSVTTFLVAESTQRVLFLSDPPSVHARLTGLPDSLNDSGLTMQVLARMLSEQWNTAASARIEAPEVAPFRRRDHRKLTYTELVLDTYNQGALHHTLIDFFGADAYGGRSLALGDSGPEVAELRADLDALGFGPLAAKDGDYPVSGGIAWATTYGRFVETAVREFQVYASMPSVARLAADDDLLPQSDDPNRPYHHSRGSGLQPVVNDQPYAGYISGVLNADTRHLLQVWLDRDWVCPVVVESRDIARADLLKLRIGRPDNDPLPLVLRSSLEAENLWDARQHPHTHTFVAWDVTGTRTESATTTHGDPAVISTYSANQWGGPYASERHRAAQAEILPVDDPGAMTPAQLSTYRVIRSIAEVEAVGYYDGVNAYDTAVISGGPLHWTLGLNKSSRDTGPGDTKSSILYRGEFAAFLGYDEWYDPDAYWQSWGRFGIHAAPAWPDPPTPPDDFFLVGHGKYSAAVGLELDDGTIADLRRNRHTDPRTSYPTRNVEDWVLSETLHHWHWVYRWALASRTDTSMHRAMWDMARARIRGLLNYPWPGRGLTIGDVFTSERAIAGLERYHVWNPPAVFGISDQEADWGTATGALVDQGEIQLAAFLTGAFAAAQALAGTDDVSQWGDAEEAALVAHLESNLTAAVDQGFPKVFAWPQYAGRGTFLFDDAQLVDVHEPAPVAASELRVDGAHPILAITMTSTATPTAGAEADPDEMVLTAEVDGLADDEFQRVRVGPGNWELWLVPAAGFTGVVTIDTVAKTRRHAIAQRYEVIFAANGVTLEVPDPELETGFPRGLSRLRNSFRFDDTGLFAEPDPWSRGA